MTKEDKPKKEKTAKAAKTVGPKTVDATAGIGHNSGKVIPELVNIVKEILASSERQKTEAKLQRDLRNRAKSEFGILSSALQYEISLQKKDPDVRVQHEQGHADLKTALGYQPELDFVGAVPTNASLKAQPSEAEIKAGEGFTVDDDDEDKGYPSEDETDDLPAGNVITREG